MSEEFLVRDLAEKLISRHVIYPRNRQFISKIIYHGKIYNLMINNLDFDEKKHLITMKQKLFGQKIMKKKFGNFLLKMKFYLILNDLEERFINFGPYSKFGISIDYESAPMIGRWIGYKIVKSYLKSNNKTIEEILNMNEYELYLNSNYKPGL